MSSDEGNGGLIISPAPALVLGGDEMIDSKSNLKAGVKKSKKDSAGKRHKKVNSIGKPSDADEPPLVETGKREKKSSARAETERDDAALPPPDLVNGDDANRNGGGEDGGNGPQRASVANKISIGMRVRQWIITGRIGAGSFGEAFTAVDAPLDDPTASPTSSSGGGGAANNNSIVTSSSKADANGSFDGSCIPERIPGKEFCIKFEQENKNVLRLEVLALKKVQACPQVVRYIASGRFLDVNFMVMEKLGPNLADLRRMSPHGNFNIYTTLNAGISCLRAIQGVHELGLIHRDIKPSNFVIGLGPNARTCYLIDFGLARRYRRSSGEVRSERENAGFRGTSRYASLRSHQHRELGRADDLWSLLFLLVEFATGTLPWRKYKEKEDIGKCKAEAINAQLVKNLPREFQPFLEHLHSLEYDSEPNYDYLVSLMEHALQRRGYPADRPLDWEVLLLQHEEMQQQDSMRSPPAVYEHHPDPGPLVRHPVVAAPAAASDGADAVPRATSTLVGTAAPVRDRVLPPPPLDAESDAEEEIQLVVSTSIGAAKPTAAGGGANGSFAVQVDDVNIPKVGATVYGDGSERDATSAAFKAADAPSVAADHPLTAEPDLPPPMLALPEQRRDSLKANSPPTSLPPHAQEGAAADDVPDAQFSPRDGGQSPVLPTRRPDSQPAAGVTTDDPADPLNANRPTFLAQQDGMANRPHQHKKKKEETSFCNCSMM